MCWEVWAAERSEGYRPTIEDRDELCFGTDVKSFTDAKQFPPSNCIFCSVGGFGYLRVCISLYILASYVRCLALENESFCAVALFQEVGNFKSRVELNRAPYCALKVCVSLLMAKYVLLNI